MTNDEHLKLLSMLHYLMACAGGLFSSLFLFHFFWGLAVMRDVPFLGSPSKADPPREMGVVLVTTGAGIVLLGLSLSVAIAFAGRSLARRTRYVYCIVVAVLMCLLCSPVGMVLGVSTIAVLMRPSVREMFAVG